MHLRQRHATMSAPGVSVAVVDPGRAVVPGAGGVSYRCGAANDVHAAPLLPRQRRHVVRGRGAWGSRLCRPGGRRCAPGCGASESATAVTGNKAMAILLRRQSSCAHTEMRACRARANCITRVV